MATKMQRLAANHVTDVMQGLYVFRRETRKAIILADTSDTHCRIRITHDAIWLQRYIHVAMVGAWVNDKQLAMTPLEAATRVAGRAQAARGAGEPLPRTP